MSDETPTAPPKSGWKDPETVFGLVALLASMILPYLPVPTGIATACAVFAGWMLGPIKSPLTATAPGERPRGYSRVGLLLVTLAVSAILTALLTSCVSIERNGAALDLQVRDSEKVPPPGCTYKLSLDGEVLHYGDVKDCTGVPRSPPKTE